MSRPRSTPYLPPSPSAPRSPLGQQSAQMLEMGEAMEPGIAPALEARLDREVFEARQEGRDFLNPVDLSTLEGQTLGESAGTSGDEFVKTPLGMLPAELAESLKQWAMDSRGPSVSAEDAAHAGTSVEHLNSIERTKRQIGTEKRYRVMIMPRYGDGEVISGSVNGVPYTIPLAKEIDLPYSLVSLMVDLGRLAPPPGCPELVASAINAGSMNAVSEMARLTKSSPGGYHHGDSADSTLAGQLDAMTQLNIQQQAGLALPANFRDFKAPATLTFGGKAL